MMPIQIINNQSRCYGPNSFQSNGNLTQFEYGLNPEYKKKMNKEYSKIGELARGDNRQPNTYLGYLDIYNNKCKI